MASTTSLGHSPGSSSAWSCSHGSPCFRGPLRQHVGWRPWSPPAGRWACPQELPPPSSPILMPTVLRDPPAPHRGEGSGLSNSPRRYRILIPKPINVSLYGKSLGRCGLIKDLHVGRLPWIIWAALQTTTRDPISAGQREIRHRRGRADVTLRQRSQPRGHKPRDGCLRPPEAGGGEEQMLSWSTQRDPAMPTAGLRPSETDLRLLASRAMRE